MLNEDFRIHDDLEIKVHKALSTWHQSEKPVCPLATLRTVQRIVDVDHLSVKQASNHVILAAMGILNLTYEHDASLLKKRFMECKTSFLVANELNVAESTLFKMQKRAIARLAQIIFQMELDNKSKLAMDVDVRVPPKSYDRLFCDNALMKQLKGLLSSSQGPWIIALTGLGGIGKTALADTVVRHLILEEQVFSDFAWISAQQQLFDPRGFIMPVQQSTLTPTNLVEMLAAQLLPKDASPLYASDTETFRNLHRKLMEKPHLVVVDNLETLSDLQTLVPLLRRLSNPTKFLLTSRESLSPGPDIYQMIIPELSKNHAIELIRHEAFLRNLTDVVSADYSTLLSIFDTVGGNPLALKLVVGQLYYLSLDRVLSNLRRSRGTKSDDLYQFIYWNSWRQLTVEAQSVLLLMPLFSETGTEIANIERVAEMKEDELQDALEQLIHLSLITVTGDFRARRYSIHRLTETFLLHEVIKWTGSGPIDTRMR